MSHKNSGDPAPPPRADAAPSARLARLLLGHRLGRRWPAATGAHSGPELLALLRGHLFQTFGEPATPVPARGMGAAQSAKQDSGQDQQSDRLHKPDRAPPEQL